MLMTSLSFGSFNSKLVLISLQKLKIMTKNIKFILEFEGDVTLPFRDMLQIKDNNTINRKVMGNSLKWAPF